MLQETLNLRDRLLFQRDSVDSRVSSTKVEIANLTRKVEVQDKIAETLRFLLNEEIHANLKAIESLLTEGLQTVFHDQNLRVRADVSESRGKVSVDLVTTHDNGDGVVIEGSPLDGFGGAVATVQSVLLRLTLILQRGLRPILFLDETLPALDGKYTMEMVRLLRALSRKLSVDILLVSHNPVVVDAADKAYRVNKIGSTASFEEIL